MKTSLTAIVLLILANQTLAQTPTRDCSALIQFDTTSLSTDYAGSWVALDSITESNYQANRNALSGSIGIAIEGVSLDGGSSFSSFAESRRKMSKEIYRSGNVREVTNQFWHILSPASAENYARCLAENGNQPISAWMVSSDTTDAISVKVRSGLAGNTQTTLSFSGATLIDNSVPQELSSGSNATFRFRRPPGDFHLDINARVHQTSATHSTSVHVPKRVRWERVRENRTLGAHLSCGAGCRGSTSGCVNSISHAALVAPPGFVIAPNTRTMASQRVLGGPGLASINIQWTESRRDANSPSGPPGSIERLDGRVRSCVGQDAHTQGISEQFWTVESYRWSYHEVPY